MARKSADYSSAFYASEAQQPSEEALRCAALEQQLTQLRAHAHTLERALQVAAACLRPYDKSNGR
jgi:hypothetical protein